MKYEEVKSRGFNEYKWFMLQRTLLKTKKYEIALIYDDVAHEVFQVRIDRELGQVIGRLKVRDLESLDRVLAFWGKDVDINQ